MTILVTGFSPFGGETVNPSWQAVEQLSQPGNGGEIVRIRLPVTYAGCAGPVLDAIRETEPGAIVMTGQAGGRTELSIERLAVNLDDAQAADNDGVERQGVPVIPHGPAAYFATLPVTAIAAHLRKAGCPAVVSNTAGLYVCNHLMYRVLHYIAASGRDIRAGFVHVPFLPEQIADRPGTPSMSLACMTAGLQHIVEFLVSPAGR